MDRSGGTGKASAGGAVDTLLDNVASEIYLLSKQAAGDKPRAFAKTSLLDWLGVAIVGSRQSKQLLKSIGSRSAVETSDNRCATILEDGRLGDAVTAAFHNGVAGHILDFDDVLITRHQPLHPTAPIAPAVLATAEALPVSGQELLQALIMGVETVFRLAQSIDGLHSARGWHATATLGTVGAGVGSALLLGSNHGQLRNAMWLAASQMAGLRAALGTFAKPLQVAKAASTGLTCALLAQTDAQLWPCLDQRDWLLSAYSIKLEDAPKSPYPRRFAIETVLYKRFPCCGETHDAINAILHIGKPPAWQALRKIRIFAPESSIQLAGVLKPATSLAARFSIPYCTSVALVNCRVGLADFDDQALADPRIAQLLECTELMSHGAKGTRVEMELRDGTTISAKPDTASNIREIATRSEFVRGKFIDNTVPLIGRALSDDLMGLVLGLDEAADIRPLSEALRRIS